MDNPAGVLCLSSNVTVQGLHMHISVMITHVHDNFVSFHSHCELLPDRAVAVQ